MCVQHAFRNLRMQVPLLDSMAAPAFTSDHDV